MAKKKQQTEIPGTERKSIEAIEEAADNLRAAKKEVKEASKARDAKVAALIAAMRKEGVQVYKFDSEDGEEEFIIDLEQLDKVRIRSKSKLPPEQKGSVN